MRYISNIVTVFSSTDYIYTHNFIVLYTDGLEGPHCLTLSKYGKGRLCESERWAMLERATEGEAEGEGESHGEN